MCMAVSKFQYFLIQIIQKRGRGAGGRRIKRKHKKIIYLKVSILGVIQYVVLQGTRDNVLKMFIG